MKNGGYKTSLLFPLNIIDKNIIKQPCIDICSAPGGKSLANFSINKDIVLNDISKERHKNTSPNNLKRLNYKPRIIILIFKICQSRKNIISLFWMLHVVMLAL